MARRAGETALDNCKKIARIMEEIDPQISGELDKNIQSAAARFKKSTKSKEDLQGWYKDQLVPLLNKCEHPVHLALQDAQGNRK